MIEFPEEHRLMGSILESPPPKRVVSLVPSLTESLFDLGFGQWVVGITDYCVFPDSGVTGCPRVGGTKNPDIEKIQRLAPDLILANQEENSRETIETMRTGGLNVWVTFPKSVGDALEDLYQLVRIFQDQQAYLQVETLERAVEWSRAAYLENPPVQYFCPIWEGETQAGELWWMTFNQDTFAADLLGIFGGRNIFAERQRAYPLEADLLQRPGQTSGERDVRYPRIGLQEIIDANPELVILPSEPYDFGKEQDSKLVAELSRAPPVDHVALRPFDGTLITWHGTRLGKALRALPSLFAGLAN